MFIVTYLWKSVGLKFDISTFLYLLWLTLWVTIWGTKADEYPYYVQISCRQMCGHLQFLFCVPIKMVRSDKETIFCSSTFWSVALKMARGGKSQLFTLNLTVKTWPFSKGSFNRMMSAFGLNRLTLVVFTGQLEGQKSEGDIIVQGYLVK